MAAPLKYYKSDSATRAVSSGISRPWSDRNSRLDTRKHSAGAPSPTGTTAPVECFDLQDTIGDMRAWIRAMPPEELRQLFSDADLVFDGEDAIAIPLVKGGQGRDALDTDQLWTSVLSVVYGLVVGALCGAMCVWLILGGAG